MEKENKNNTVLNIYKEWEKEHTPPRRPTERERERVNTELLATLPALERMFVLNLIGRKTKRTPFESKLYCICGEHFYEREPHKPQSYTQYRRGVLCPHCFKGNYNEQPPQKKKERRTTSTEPTRDELIRRYFTLK